MSWLYFLLFIVFLTSCGCWKNTNNNNKNSNSRIDINGLVDDSIADIRKGIAKFGFDPVKVPTIRHNISVGFGFSSVTVELNLTNGTMYGASKMKRAGNFYLDFLQATVRLFGKIHIDKLYGRFNYSYSTFLYSDSGVLNTTVENVTAILQVDYRLDQFKILNPRFKILHIGLTTVDMKSDAAFSWVTNAVTNAVLPFFKDEVTNISETTFLKIAKRSITYVNTHLSDIIANIIVKMMTSFYAGNRRMTWGGYNRG